MRKFLIITTALVALILNQQGSTLALYIGGINSGMIILDLIDWFKSLNPLPPEASFTDTSAEAIVEAYGMLQEKEALWNRIEKDFLIDIRQDIWVVSDQELNPILVTLSETYAKLIADEEGKDYFCLTFDELCHSIYIQGHEHGYGEWVND